MARAPTSAAAAEPAAAVEHTTYEGALQELEQIVAQLEGASLPLDRLLERYTRAGELLRFCRGRLEAVEAQVKVLEGNRLEAWKPDA
jgi:exodeoxyribonuclease VII small subunit